MATTPKTSRPEPRPLADAELRDVTGGAGMGGAVGPGGAGDYSPEEPTGSTAGGTAGGMGGLTGPLP